VRAAWWLWFVNASILAPLYSVIVLAQIIAWDWDNHGLHHLIIALDSWAILAFLMIIGPPARPSGDAAPEETKP
jgi:hypothetical protein